MGTILCLEADHVPNEGFEVGIQRTRKVYGTDERQKHWMSAYVIHCKPDAKRPRRGPGVALPKIKHQSETSAVNASKFAVSK